MIMFKMNNNSGRYIYPIVYTIYQLDVELQIQWCCLMLPFPAALF